MNRTPTIALFSGSLRHGSTNSSTLRTVAYLLPDTVRTVTYDGMGDLPHFSPDEDTADPHPEVARLRATIAEADILLFCTPEYAGSLPGSFKNLLDWTIGGVETQDRLAAWINISSSVTRAEGAHRTLRDVLRYTGVQVVEEACLQIPVARNVIDPERGIITDPEIRNALQSALDVLLDDATRDEVAALP